MSGPLARLAARLVPLPLLLVAAAPPSGATPYEAGVAARKAGDTARAVTLLTQAMAAEPGNADAQVQLGYALLAAGRLDEAQRAFERTLALAPGYSDASEGLKLVAARRSAPPSLPYRFELDLDGSYSALDRGRPDWKEGAAELRYRPSGGTAVAARLEQSRRFGLDDTYGEVRYERRLARGSFYLLAGGTPNADFRPRWQVGAGGSLKVRPGPSATVLTLDARQARYRAGDIRTVTPGIEQYLAAGRMWLTGRLINTFDENGRHHLGWLGRGDWQVRPALRLFAGYSDAPDTSEGRVVETRSVFGGLAWDASRRVTWRLSAAREHRADGGNRSEIGLGLGLRF